MIETLTADLTFVHMVPVAYAGNPGDLSFRNLCAMEIANCRDHFPMKFFQIVIVFCYSTRKNVFVYGKV
jgi:hypothetical protein